jgi:homopolymeric O-antigen transport system ATP-binding protein
MSDIIIAAEHLAKSYLVGHQSTERERYTALRDVIAREARNFARKGLDFVRGRQIVQGDEIEEFWALRDVSFEVKRGGVLGVIGRNGAGKSTLLKILSRITEPDRGRAILRGRVASLLEVGTGFHPELTGRENIFLNGAILGMTKAEIRSKFDEIVAFAEVERFLDTPVKRYSSGMYVRLAFSIAAHLEPEILIVDEVLAVGDAEFQKKCLGKMEKVTRAEGRTVLFVSHNMAAVEAICHQCLWLEHGKLAAHGKPGDIIAAYLGATDKIVQHVSLKERNDRAGTGRVRAISFSIKDSGGNQVKKLRSGQSYKFMIGYENIGEPIRNGVASFDVYDEYNRVLLFRSTFTKESLALDARGVISCFVERLPLAKGSYTCSIYLSDADVETLDYIEQAAPLVVEDGDFFGTGSAGLPSHCKVLTVAHWSSEKMQKAPHVAAD